MTHLGPSYRHTRSQAFEQLLLAHRPRRRIPIYLFAFVDRGEVVTFASENAAPRRTKLAWHCQKSDEQRPQRMTAVSRERRVAQPWSQSSDMLEELPALSSNDGLERIVQCVAMCGYPWFAEAMRILGIRLQGQMNVGFSFPLRSSSAYASAAGFLMRGQRRLTAQTCSHPVEYESVSRAEISTSPRRSSSMKFTHGSGAATVMMPASRHVAPTVPNRSYICDANSGNPPAKHARTNAFPARAEAAIGRKADTRYVQVDEKQRMNPTPYATDAIMGAIQCTRLNVVNASQNRLSGTITPPNWPCRRCTSGAGVVPANLRRWRL